MSMCVSAYIQGSNGEPRLHEDCQHTTCLSIGALNWMFSVPAAAAEIVKADPAGLLLQIMQDPSFESIDNLDAAVMCSLWHLNCQPAGRQQLLLQLTPDSCRVVIQMALKYLESPPDHEACVCAAGELLRTHASA